MHEVATPEELVELVRSEPRVRVRGGGTKSATISGANVSVANLSGVLQYDPGEFTFTALAGTRITEVEQLLAEKNQYLPFDPPLVNAGATLGGTVASGLSGSGRYQYGGVRDFLLGARIVTGEGQIVMTGSKVVKNAAGFDLPKLMVGSLGCFGLLTDLTFKVFPRPKRFATIVFETEDVHRGVALMKELSVSNLDLACVDMDKSNRVWVRIAGLPESVAQRSERVLRHVDYAGRVLSKEEEADYWHECREFLWVPEDHDLVKVAITPDKVESLSVALGGSPMRTSVGGHLAWIAWPTADDAQELHRLLHDPDCSWFFVKGGPSSPFVGVQRGKAFRKRLRAALDPHQKFALV